MSNRRRSFEKATTHATKKIRLQRSFSFDSPTAPKHRKRLRKVATVVLASNRVQAWAKKKGKKKKKKKKKNKKSQLEKFDQLMEKERTRSRARGNRYVRCFSSIRILPSSVSDFFTGSFTYSRPVRISLLITRITNT